MEFDPSLPWRVFHADGFHGLVGPIRFARGSETEWRFYLDLEARHINIGGVCHGGVSMTLADIGMGAAAFEAGGKRACSTIQFESQFVAAAKEGQRLHGFARVVRRTQDLAFMEAKLFAGGRQTLNATGVWRYFAPRE